MSSSNLSTRDRILEATCTLLEEKPGAGTRMSDIAKAAKVSRQAVYLHFENRADLLIAAMRDRDEKTGVEARLEPSRTAANGEKRVALFIEFWANQLPRIYALARALWMMRDSDPAAAAAWDERMAALRDGCAAAIHDIHSEGKLAEPWTQETATDLFWAMLSVQNWEILTQECGWSDAEYTANLTLQAQSCFIRQT